MRGRGNKGDLKEREEGDTNRGLFGRFVETVIVFVVCCYLVRLGVSILISVRVPLTIIALIVGGGVILWRSYLWRKHKDDY